MKEKLVKEENGEDLLDLKTLCSQESRAIDFEKYLKKISNSKRKSIRGDKGL